MTTYFYTADWHVGHKNIIKYCNRPFDSVDEMNHTLITKHNEVVTTDDITLHVGDFTLSNKDYAADIIRQLNGRMIFIIGSHDYWLQGKSTHIWEKTIEDQHVVACHYAMYSWPRSHHGSWLLYGHHHGKFSIPCKAIDVGVDTHNFYPYSHKEVVDIMGTKPITPGTIPKRY